MGDALKVFMDMEALETDRKIAGLALCNTVFWIYDRNGKAIETERFPLKSSSFHLIAPKGHTRIIYFLSDGSDIFFRDFSTEEDVLNFIDALRQRAEAFPNIRLFGYDDRGEIVIPAYQSEAESAQ